MPVSVTRQLFETDDRKSDGLCVDVNQESIRLFSLFGFPQRIPVCIRLGEAFPFAWKLLDGKDCGHGAYWYAGPAVDALFGIDVKLRYNRILNFVLSWMNTVTWANVNARGILGTDARLGDYVGHFPLL